MNSKISPFGYNEKRYPNVQEATMQSDLLILGSSQAYSGFDPRIFDTNLGIHTYNLGTPAEVPVVTYYRFEEAIKKSNPKVVIVDIYFRILRYDVNFQYIPQWLKSVSKETGKKIMNELPLKDRLKIVFNVTGMDQNISELLRNFSKERSAGHKGFVSVKKKASLETLEEENRFKDYTFETNHYVAKNIEYLDKIIESSKKRGIKVIFVTTPLPKSSVEKIENYNEIHNFIKDHLSKKGVDYYDFNILKNPVFIDTEDFEDGNHLNYFGATKISEYISKEILKEEMFK
jgi:lysophospholipase L1-like esterase